MPRFTRSWIASLAIVLAVAFLSAAHLLRAEDKPAAAPPAKRIKNAIVMIGDGMGVAHITLARVVTVGADGRLAMDSFPATGLVTTHSSNYPTTDSAAAATALSSGYKTKNQVIGQTPEGQARLTIAELAHRKGLATGLVTTTTVTHATPAGFCAHVGHRAQETEIAKQLVDAAEIDVLLGGGQKMFSPELLAELGKKSYQVVKDRDALLAAKGQRLVGLFSHEHMSFDVDRDPKVEPSLAEMTRKALETLREDPDGFFLMVEGGKIDHSGHSHDAAGVVFETRAFDAAVKVARDFAKDTGDTLVLVTADHSTGAPAITENLDIEGLLKVSASTERIAKELAAPGVDIRAIVKQRTGVALGDEDVKALEEALQAEKGGQPYVTQTVLGHRISRRFGVGFLPLEVLATQKSTKGHDGAMVAVLAFGPGSELFVGVQDNTELPKKIVRLLGWPVEELGVPR
ncbi:MAG: alkaline phosphatase [Planctomycetes bacterium]|nr:alkaline phosphatase [Planctomycetota bacterium]